MMRVGIILSVLFMSLQVFAQEDPCSEQNEKDVNLPSDYSFHRVRSEATDNKGACTIYISKTPYSYTLYNEGRFNMSYWPENDRRGTVRSYFFFPRKAAQNAVPEFKKMTTGDYELTTMSGTKVRISSDTTRIKEISQASLTDDPQLKSKKIEKAEFLMLDMGVRVGTTPGARRVFKKNGKFSYQYAKSKFVDSKGKKCEVSDDLIIDYPSDRPENTEGKLKFGNELYQVLLMQPQCKDLDISALLKESEVELKEYDPRAEKDPNGSTLAK
jgi:hypothetical protein